MREAEFVNDSEYSTGRQAQWHSNDEVIMHGGTLRWKEEESVGIALREEFADSGPIATPATGTRFAQNPVTSPEEFAGMPRNVTFLHQARTRRFGLGPPSCTETVATSG